MVYKVHVGLSSLGQQGGRMIQQAIIIKSTGCSESKKQEHPTYGMPGRESGKPSWM